MDILVLVLVSFGASCLTFFSGFGLGTMLTPVFIVLTGGDLVLAMMMTAIVHFANNVFKFLLMKKSIDWSIALRFGGIAIPAAALGAYLISDLEEQVVFAYAINGGENEIFLSNLIFGFVLIVFALIELIPKWGFFFAKANALIGGLLSGFFGGLSGHQGALRTAFLIKFKLSKEAFIATGIVIALVVDIVRTPFYFIEKKASLNIDDWLFVGIATGAALTGAIMGKMLLKKIKLKTLNITVGIAMLVFGILLAAGILNR